MEYQKKASLKSIVASARMTSGVSVCYSYSPTQDSSLDTGVVSGGKAVRCIYMRSGSRSIYETRPSMIDPSCPIKNRLASPLAQIHNLRPIQSTVNCPNPTSPSTPSLHNENSNSQGLSLTKKRIAKSSVPLLARFQRQEHTAVGVGPGSQVRAHGLGAFVPVPDMLTPRWWRG
jgi:hypothetical protein